MQPTKHIRRLAIIAIAAAVIICAGCAQGEQKTWTVKTKSGAVYEHATSDDAEFYKNWMVSFKSNGKEVHIQRREIESVEEESK